MNLLSIYLFLLALSIGSPALAASDSEQWCRDNPGICQCSEPLEATAYSPVPPFNIYWNPNDSTLNQCRQDNQLGAFITRNNNNSIRPTPSTNATVLQRLSLGGTQIKVPAVLKVGEGATGIYEAGHAVQNRSTLSRVNIRWYLYRSAGDEGDGVNAHIWADKANGPCNNSSKWFEVYWSDGPASSQWDHAWGQNDYPQVYAWSRFTPQLDCCQFGPGATNFTDQQARITRVQPNGHWYRMEVSINGNIQGGPGLRMEAWRKDITANLPEEKIVDTGVACAGCQSGGPNAGDPSQAWTAGSGATTTLTPPGGLVNPTLQWFKDYAGGGGSQFTGCPGSYYISHVVYAGWQNNLGQRIGGASEIEGNGGDTTPPQTPTNLRITQLILGE